MENCEPWRKLRVEFTAETPMEGTSRSMLTVSDTGLSWYMTLGLEMERMELERGHERPSRWTRL